LRPSNRVKAKKRKRTVRKEKKVKHGPPVLLPSKISHERRHDLKELKFSSL